MRIKELIYLPFWFFKAKFLGVKKPLQSVIFITDYCNLSCKHCAKDGHGCSTMKSYKKIKKELEYSYEMGSRFVDFEGGEPTLWQDESYNLNDLYNLAKEIGYFSGTLTTNAQNSFEDTLADNIWVSLDGVAETHDMIRGIGAFEKLDKNIRKCRKKSICVNMAINNINKNNVIETIKFAKEHPHIKLISLNFHTPYPGTEDLMIKWEERYEIIDSILEMKKNGFPIMNSKTGLKNLKKKNYKKYCWITNFILVDGMKFSECPGKSIGICDQCGFGMAGEMNGLMRFKPDTLFAGLNLRITK